MKRPLCIRLGSWYALASTLDPATRLPHQPFGGTSQQYRASGTATLNTSHSPVLSMMGFKSANQTD